MAINKETTSDGREVLRDSKTGDLLGSVGWGKDHIPTALQEKLISKAKMAPQLTQKVNPYLVAFQAFEKIKGSGQLKDLPEISISGKDTSKLIKTTLSSRFPGVKFSVRYHSYAGGSSINIYWTDGPTTQEVDEARAGFEGADFDGMTDMKSYNESVLMNLPEALNPSGGPALVDFRPDFIFTNRELSEGYKKILAIFAQDVLTHNSDTKDLIFDEDLRYPPLGTDYGTFHGGNGYELVNWLGSKVSSKTVATF